MSEPSGLKSAPKSKLEMALAERPRVFDRSQFNRPGQWATALMNGALLKYEDYFRILQARAYANVLQQELSAQDYAKLRNFWPLCQTRGVE